MCEAKCFTTLTKIYHEINGIPIEDEREKKPPKDKAKKKETKPKKKVQVPANDNADIEKQLTMRDIAEE